MAAPQKNESDSILTKTLVIAVALVAAIIPVAIWKEKPATPDAEEADIRIQPVARLEIQQAVAPATDGKPKDGKTVFDTTCGACHNTGTLGAPKVSDKAAWAPRIAQGKETLYKSALNGKNAMPARGGNTSLSEAEVKGAVDHILGLVR